MSEEHKARTREMIDVMQAYVDGRKIEFNGNILVGDEPCWNWTCGNYRIAPTADSIDWDHVALRWRYMARGKNGLVSLYYDRPFILHDRWHSTHHEMTINEFTYLPCAFASYKRGTVPWEDSLVERPK